MKVSIMVTVTKENFIGDPPIDLYTVEMRNGRGVWKERLVKRDLDLYFHALRAGAKMAGGTVDPFDIPE